MTSSNASSAREQQSAEVALNGVHASALSFRLRKRSNVEPSHLPVQSNIACVRWQLSVRGYVWGEMPAWRAFTGQTHDAVLGNGWLNAVHADDRDRLCDAWERAKTAQKPYVTVCRILRYDGSYSSVSLHMLPTLDVRGHLRGWDCTGVVLAKQSEYHQQCSSQFAHEHTRDLYTRSSKTLEGEYPTSATAESAIARSQASERRFQCLVEANIIGIVISDENRVLEANDIFLHMLGYSREEIEAGHLTKDALLTPESAALREKAVQEALRTGASQPVEREYVRRDGSRFPALVGTALLERNPTQFVSFVLDLSERKRLEHEREEARTHELALRQVNERMDTFFAMAAHDLRHPVAVSLLEVQQAQRRVLKASQTRHHAGSETDHIVPFVEVESALEATARQLGGLWRLLQQLLDVTRARQGRLVLDRQICDLASLVRQTVEEQRLLLPTRLVSLDLPTADTNLGAGRPLQVAADTTRLGQVLTNFLSNALRYSPEDQPVQVRLRQVASEGVARVEVQDFGIGIPAREQAKIWGRFQQAQNAAKTSGGLGLGLYIARIIVELHHGKVGVESKEGQGSTFWFTLPLTHSPE